MVSVEERIRYDIPGFGPWNFFFVDKNSHQLGDSKSRMSLQGTTTTRPSETMHPVLACFRLTSFNWTATSVEEFESVETMSDYYVDAHNRETPRWVYPSS